MDFTREPVIETIITPKDGCKLAVRNSKGAGQEEFFVDAVEIVSFGNSFFFRSMERPKSFFVPVTDYEILEVRETRMVLKNVGSERTIKIGGGKDNQRAPAKEEKVKVEVDDALPIEPRVEKKRERRRSYRRRRGGAGSEENRESDDQSGERLGEAPRADEGHERETAEERLPEDLPPAPPLILEPPKTLISETITRYRESGMYTEAFFEQKGEASEESAQSDEDCDGEAASQEVAETGAGFPEESASEGHDVEEPLVATADEHAEPLELPQAVEMPNEAVEEVEVAQEQPEATEEVLHHGIAEVEESMEEASEAEEITNDKLPS